jgi:threonine dehydrogenase-like Zn-dependent dehydrogenase
MLGARLYERRDFEVAVNQIATGQVPAADLITGVFPLTQAGSSFAELARGGAMKILVDCTDAGNGVA